MTKFIIGFIILIAVIALGFTLIQKGGILGKKTTVTFGKEKLTLDVADTEKKRQLGLSSRRSLGKNDGMLFVFPTSDYPTFWMKGMSFPIDIIFLNEKKVVTIYKIVPAPKSTSETPTTTYAPSSPSDRVIELKAGRVDELGIKTGDSISIPL